MMAWVGLRRTHDLLIRQVGGELERRHGMTLTEYEALRHLAEAPRRRLALGVLAEAALLTPSGITRLVDRLERRGWMERFPDGQDGRRWLAAVTPAGLSAVRAASRTHASGIQTAFVSRIGSDGAANLNQVWSRLTGP
jgi:DNA-binding MarR family transcriptional regulator